MSATKDTDLSTAISAHDDWRTNRHTSLTGPTGNLSLTLTRWFPTGTTEAEAAAEVSAARADAADGVTVTELSRRNINTDAPEFGLRVWDANSAAIQAFTGVDAFDYNPDWVVDAQFTPVSSDRTVPFEHIRDAGGTRNLVVPGDITFERDGQTFTLAAFDDDGTLLLVFGDPTNRATDDTQTYGAGRFLFVEFVEGETNHAAGGAVRLDFNRAFVPPCGFSVQYNCPMPPAQNRLPWAVHAGEKLPRFSDGFDIYA
ncbi:uncharacterized protein (DUF1684 family) [Leucobacter exalbidus]|uniref:Uncharacterized protein (DUF1684 family) n=1 Tax=Leucobacter exalbidus TaxID=662960 RepID=A0A940PTK6_9MICO|nr:DUF1684 domain-containing protein [Leucobacter exalbidus]MBP1326637.1 uncharacterized protein (DUF1684 family) [Leucobacter exalbidus]